MHQAPALASAKVPRNLLVAGITLDSRAVRPGDLYAALPGATTHGARFADQATDAGAAAILTDASGSQLCPDSPVPVIVVADPRAMLGDLSSWIYHQPAGDLLLIGVTGTNGKTTMTYLLAEALAAAGHTTGVIGTIGIKVGHQDLPSARTTPEAPDVHAALAVMREQGVTAVAMEVSSHALVLGRVAGLAFDVAVFTNLSQDHLDFHQDMADYFAAKRQLFEPGRSKRAVICVDDAWGRRLAESSEIPRVTYGRDEPADWSLVDLRVLRSGGWDAAARGPNLTVPVSSDLPGRFNQANVLGALAAAAGAGIDPQAAAAGLARCRGVPGRMEAVSAPEFAAFVDYAHTPEAVARAIGAVREFSSGKVIVALGCGGDRDPGKRPLMGIVAARGADIVIVTDDNPRSEDPAMIRQAVLEGAVRAESGAEISEIPDRAAAIRAAVDRAQPGDAVLILGKGHEQGQEVRGVVTPFDDRVVLASAITAGGAR